MTPEYQIDLGIRCDRHTAQVFLPKCGACLALTSEWRVLNRARYDYDAPVECSIDKPCAQCLERAEADF